MQTYGSDPYTRHICASNITKDCLSSEFSVSANGYDPSTTDFVHKCPLLSVHYKCPLFPPTEGSDFAKLSVHV